MELWLDSAEEEQVEQASRLGIIHGVTTNPRLLMPEIDSRPIIKRLLALQEGPVMVQVREEEASKMLDEAGEWIALSKKIIIKVPVTQEGLKVMHILRKEQVVFTATTVFQPRQVLLAALAGAHYIAPYLGRIEESGVILEELLPIMRQLAAKSSLLAAGIRSLDHLFLCASQKLPAVTIPPSVFEALLAPDPLTEKALQAFRSPVLRC